MNREILKKLYENNSLTKTDVYTDKRGFTIITRSGIEKIERNQNIKVEYEMIVCEKNMVVIKATSYINDEPQKQTYGSATDENCMNKFKVEVAEKRALARVIIKTTGLDALGQAEVEDQQKTKIVNSSVTKLNVDIK